MFVLAILSSPLYFGAIFLSPCFQGPNDSGVAGAPGPATFPAHSAPLKGLIVR